MRSILAISVVLLSTLCWVVSPSLAQSFTGSIIGTIKNTNGEVVPNAEITITQIQTNKVITVMTNNEGYYTSPPLPVGDYRVEAKMAGFRRAVRSGLSLQIQ